MRLAQVLEGVPVVKLFSLMFGRMVLTQDITIRSLQYDSRKVQPSDLFVAIRGTAADGHAFVNSALHNGAVAVVMESDASVPDALFMHTNAIKIVVQDSRAALARMAANFFGHPSRHLTLIGVTGTNGKTTTTHLIKSVFEASGAKVGLIGTIEYMIGSTVRPATHTTPESLELNQLLSEMVTGGCTTAVMEVSSHSLAMHRVDGLSFRAGVFTNLTQDHLDFHGTMQSYRAAKSRLFTGLDAGASAITNADDPTGLLVVEGTRAEIVSYGVERLSSFRGEHVEMGVRGMNLSVTYGSQSQAVRSSLTGRFNVSNILAAFATGVSLGIPATTVTEGIAAVRSVRGRFEQISSPAGWTAIVDYAHTPDALENCLRTVHELLPAGGPGRVITVFGCGGNRDRGKRPLMGRIASDRSDQVFVTSDNPRREDPDAIIDEIMSGIPTGRSVRREADRRRAIRAALGEARRGDVVVVAGKGHEDYQVIGETRIHFDDREEVEAFIRETR